MEIILWHIYESYQLRGVFSAQAQSILSRNRLSHCEGDSWSESSPVKPVRQFWIKRLYPARSVALTVDRKIKVNLQSRVSRNVERILVAKRYDITTESGEKKYLER